jgi:hypothetical protein
MLDALSSVEGKSTVIAGQADAVTTASVLAPYVERTYRVRYCNLHEIGGLQFKLNVYKMLKSL